MSTFRRTDLPPSSRSIQLADRCWLRAAIRSERSHLQGAGRRRLLSSLHAPNVGVDPLSQVVECDGRLVGFALLRRARQLDASPLQPWSARERREILRPDPRGDILQVVALGWRRGSEAPRWQARVIREGCQRVGQRIGAERLVHATAPARSEDGDDAASPEAYLQQLHHRAYDDRALTPLLEQGWRLDGYRPAPEERSAPFEGIVIWDP